MTDGPGWAAPGAPPSGGSGAPGWGTPLPPAGPGGFGQAPPPQPGYPGQPPQGQPPQWSGGPPGPQNRWRWNAAPKPGIIPLRPLALGEILDGTFAAVRTNPGATVGITLASAAVVETASTLITIGTDNASTAVGVLGTVATFVLDLVLGLFLAGVLSVVVSEATLGSRIGPTDAVRRLAPRLAGLFGLTAVVALAIAIGTLALLVGAVVVGVYLSLATPVYVLEGGSLRQSLRRSRTIVRGSWWRTFGILLLASLVALLLSAVFAIATGLVLASAPGVFGDFLNGDLTTSGHIVEGLGNLLATTVSTPIMSGAVVLIYIDLRIRREGLDVTLSEAARARSAGAGTPG
ncbi:hypothetical protein [Frankia sp. AgB32]|uniref:hypothetical protein n=1 Tax=Frankia sp. AgB32 TaxID=631119 RepID=UPI00201042CA|nr:hypothetical protein [Frankia sp. AgB32]MCK9893786.1 hypothetical protein [Frankia sp. AgB32]